MDEKSPLAQNNLKSYIAWTLALTLIGIIAFRLYTLFGLPFETHRESPFLEDLKPNTATGYDVGPYAQALMRSDHPSMEVSDKRLVATLMERQLMINRSTPRLVNPMLTLKDVNYRQSKNTFEYNYIINDRLDLTAFHSLKRRLNERYCESEELQLMRDNKVKVIWRYWSKDGRLLQTVTSKPCS